MTLSVPSFFAAATSAAIPPPPAADVAVFHLLSLADDEPPDDEQPAAASASTTIPALAYLYRDFIRTLPISKRIRGRRCHRATNDQAGRLPPGERRPTNRQTRLDARHGHAPAS